ncbi:unnamed protein product [Rotaria socialis]|uniref:Uncharacterized protein n=1 Tax=Rotaria socialis TaxID=392032 RepID=A0A818FXE6_9BILA|nr:unnamed protein product [Rotaria socialis]
MSVTAISDEKFGEIINQKPSSVGHRIHELLDDTIFFLNQHYGIKEEQGSQLDQLMNQIKHICLDVMHNNELMGNKISILEDRIQHLENKQNTSNKLRTTAELLTPIVKDIRNSMINQQISDNYHSPPIINACILHLDGKNMSWEISDFNFDNRRDQFNIDKFHQFESIIQHHGNNLRVSYRILLELLRVKFNRNQLEHESIKKILRYRSGRDLSVAPIGTNADVCTFFGDDIKVCIEGVAEMRVVLPVFD